ncbi:hypothetical protein PI124_g14453 [Phytophthora idaei]|nr:hypothetical protein PI125_g14213 [Phytophthora idaei]KAG3146399.1 hypothetical protein PI126_g13337 [Phytophthora idaei]KAG3240655.1 hypothetical protein PI124_g14453 [Phytophthora idaei]
MKEKISSLQLWQQVFCSLHSPPTLLSSVEFGLLVLWEKFLSLGP